jgi:hypothetical protein
MGAFEETLLLPVLLVLLVLVLVLQLNQLRQGAALIQPAPAAAPAAAPVAAPAAAPVLRRSPRGSVQEATAGSSRLPCGVWATLYKGQVCETSSLKAECQTVLPWIRTHGKGLQGYDKYGMHVSQLNYGEADERIKSYPGQSLGSCLGEVRVVTMFAMVGEGDRSRKEVERAAAARLRALERDVHNYNFGGQRKLTRITGGSPYVSQSPRAELQTWAKNRNEEGDTGHHKGQETYWHSPEWHRQQLSK